MIILFVCILAYLEFKNLSRDCGDFQKITLFIGALQKSYDYNVLCKQVSTYDRNI